MEGQNRYFPADELYGKAVREKHDHKIQRQKPSEGGLEDLLKDEMDANE